MDAAWATWDGKRNSAQGPLVERLQRDDARVFRSEREFATMERHALLAASAVLLTACATGGMYDQPYSLFEPHAARQTRSPIPARR